MASRPTPAPVVLPPAPEKYDRDNEQRARNALVLQDGRTAKVDADFSMAPGAGQIVIDTDGTGRRWRLTVAAGVLTPVLVA